MAKSLEKWQFCDFQTPQELADQVVQILKGDLQISPKFILEPSCGKGAFLLAALDAFESAKVIGLALLHDYKKRQINGRHDQY